VNRFDLPIDYRPMSVSRAPETARTSPAKLQIHLR